MDEVQAEQGLRAAGVRRNRRSILDAARRQLIEAGYHRLSLEGVAAEAGVTRVTIYRQFKSKLGLLDAVAEDLAARAQIVLGLHEAETLADSSAAFHALVAELCRFWTTDPDLFRRLINLGAVDPQARRVIDDREHWRYQRVSAVVGRLAAEGRVRAPFDERSASATTAAVTGFAACDEMATRLRCDFDQLIDQLIALLGGVVRLD